MRALLIGGAGFMGGRTARALRDAGHEVSVLTRGGQPVGDGIETLTADRRDPAALIRALAGRRFEFTVDFVAFDAPDIESLLHVRDAVLGRYVMISTGQVYLVRVDAQPPFREGDEVGPLLPEPADEFDRANWEYGAGKRRAEATLARLREIDGVRALALRLPVVQGEGDPSLRLWAWLERMLDGGPVPLPDGGVRPVRFLFADDVAESIARLAGGRWPAAGAYNLASPRALALHEFLAEVARLAGLAPNFVAVGREAMRDAGLDPSMLPYASRWVSELDPTRATEELGFEGTPLEAWLPGVVSSLFEHRPASHPGYAQRARECAWLEGRMAAGTSGSTP